MSKIGLLFAGMAIAHFSTYARYATTHDAIAAIDGGLRIGIVEATIAIVLVAVGAALARTDGKEP